MRSLLVRRGGLGEASQSRELSRPSGQKSSSCTIIYIVWHKRRRVVVGVRFCFKVHSGVQAAWACGPKCVKLLYFVETLCGALALSAHNVRRLDGPSPSLRPRSATRCRTPRRGARRPEWFMVLFDRMQQRPTRKRANSIKLGDIKLIAHACVPNVVAKRVTDSARGAVLCWPACSTATIFMLGVCVCVCVWRQRYQPTANNGLFCA